ncbi:unnamed protein product, partial [Amoebophrya sp. A25]|eukprot:GSA25T00000522001.1
MESLQIDPGNPDAWNMIGRWFFQQHKRVACKLSEQAQTVPAERDRLQQMKLRYAFLAGEWCTRGIDAGEARNPMWSPTSG